MEGATAITEFAYAVCIQDILAKVHGATAGLLRPASFAAYAGAAPFFEILRNERFAAAASQMRLPRHRFSGDGGAGTILFALCSQVLKNPTAAPIDGQPEQQGYDTEISEIWLEAFRDIPWDLAELSLYPEAADAMQLGVLPEHEVYGDFAFEFLDHRDTAETYQSTRSRLRTWCAPGLERLPALVHLRHLRTHVDRAKHLEAALVGNILQAGATVGVRAELAIASNQLPILADKTPVTGKTAQAAQMLFEKQIAQRLPKPEPAEPSTGAEYRSTIAEFLVALIRRDCDFIDQAVASLGLDNPVLHDEPPAPALAGVEETGALPYQVYSGNADPDLAAWMAEDSTNHPVVDRWRERIKAQIS